jgi:predicted MFS family arabinose efflux permease
LLSTGLFKNRTSNLGLATQNIQWLLLMGTSFVVAVYLQTVRGYNAIETGVIFTAATLGLLLALVGVSSRVVAFVPGLLLIGLGLGVMLTPSVSVVQSSFPEELQGEISGLSRSVSNLGSSFGTAVAGTILVSDLASGNQSYVIAMVTLAVLGLVGLAAAARLPRKTPDFRSGGWGSSARPSAVPPVVAGARPSRRRRRAAR